MIVALTNEEVRAYREGGYVVPAYRIPEERMAVLSAAMEEFIRTASTDPSGRSRPAPSGSPSTFL